MTAASLVALPPLDRAAPFPTREWSHAALDSRADAAALAGLLARAFATAESPELGRTHALLVVHRGAIVAEHYGPAATEETTLPSWSMAKSVLHALVGVCVRDRRIDPSAPLRVPEWSASGDPRAAIALEHLLRMTSGLAFVEDYVDAGVSDVIEMLFGAGRDDVAGFAARKPLVHPPGAVFSYSSGTSNVLSRIVADAVGGGDAAVDLLRREILEPIGMQSAMPRQDAAGHWIASSFLFATARDFARFGLLYLRDGTWEGRRILPPGWVDHARTPTPAAVEDPYGAHWWLGRDDLGTFAARGYEGQYTVVVPQLDLVVVRLGQSPAELKPNLLAFLDAIVDCFRATSDRPT